MSSFNFLWEMEVNVSIGNQQKISTTQVIYKKDKR